MKLIEIRAKGEKELAKLLDEKQEALFGLRLQHSTGQLAKNAGLRQARKVIARIKTVMKERELGIKRDGKTTAKAKKH